MGIGLPCRPLNLKFKPLGSIWKSATLNQTAKGFQSVQIVRKVLNNFDTPNETWYATSAYSLVPGILCTGN